MPEQSILKILQYYAGYFAQSDLFGIGFVTLFRQLGWWILQGLAWICDQLEGLVDTAYELINITTGAVAQKYYDKLTALLSLLATFALVILGLRFILGRKKRPQNVVGNIALAVAVITLLPLFMIKMNEGLLLFREYFSMPGSSNSEQILMNSMTDLSYMETQNWYYDPLTGSFSDEGKPRMDTALGLDNININETVDGDWGSVWRKILLYDENGNAFIDDMKETSVLGVVIIPAQSYYRYHFDFLTPFITLLATIIAMFFSLWKIVRIIFEIVQNRFFATFMAFSDFSSGQRAKQFLRGIFDSYFVLLFITVIMQLFFVFQEYINAQSWNGLTKAFFIFLASLGVIDGPNMIERVFGIDAGLARSAVGTIANMARATRGMKSAASAIKAGKKRIVEGTAAKAGYVSGRFGGEKEKEQKERVTAVNQNQQEYQKPPSKEMVPVQPGLQKSGIGKNLSNPSHATEKGGVAPQQKGASQQNRSGAAIRIPSKKQETEDSSRIQPDKKSENIGNDDISFNGSTRPENYMDRENIPLKTEPIQNGWNEESIQEKKPETPFQPDNSSMEKRVPTNNQPQNPSYNSKSSRQQKKSTQPVTSSIHPGSPNMKTGQAEKAERQSSFAPSSAPVSETREYVSSHSAVRNETSTKELSVPPMELSNERRQYVESAPYPTFDFSNDESGVIDDEQIRQSLEQARARMERLRPYNTLRDQYEKGRQKGQQRTQYNKARHEVIRLQREQNRRTRTKGRIDKQ